jgi:hypothetical protein
LTHNGPAARKNGAAQQRILGSRNGAYELVTSSPLGGVTGERLPELSGRAWNRDAAKSARRGFLLAKVRKLRSGV